MESSLATTADTVIVGVPMMDAAEAREYLKLLRWDLEAADQALTNFRARALDFAERQGWKALGYGGAIEALQTELGAQYSKSYLSRILQAGEIERVLELPIGQLPERTLRPLAQLDTPAEQRQAYSAVQGKPTAEKVQQAVNQIKPPLLPDLSPFGFTARAIADGRIAIRSAGNLESQHTHAQLNDLIAHWRTYPPIPADLAARGVVWRYRQDKLYQVRIGDAVGHTGYTAAEALQNQRESMERAGLLVAPTAPGETDDSAIIAEIREKASALGLGVIWEDDTVILHWPEEHIDQLLGIGYQDALYWLATDGAQQAQARAQQQKIAPAAAPTLADLDASLPADLIKAGYYWHSATPPTMAQNGSPWQGSAPIADQAIELARLRMDANGDPLTVFPALTPMECKALIREAKVFVESGLDRKLPTIGKILRIAARMALEATE